MEKKASKTGEIQKAMCLMPEGTDTLCKWQIHFSVGTAKPLNNLESDWMNAHAQVSCGFFVLTRTMSGVAHSAYTVCVWSSP